MTAIRSAWNDLSPLEGAHGKIDFNGERETMWDEIKEDPLAAIRKMKDTFAMYQIDAHSHVKYLGNEAMRQGYEELAADFYHLFKSQGLSDGIWKGTLRCFLEVGLMDRDTGQIVVRSLASILDDLAAGTREGGFGYKDFWYWLTAMRDQEVIGIKHKKGEEYAPLYTEDERASVLADYTPEQIKVMEKVRAEFKRWTDAILERLHASGYLSTEQLKELKGRKYYVPFFRSEYALKKSGSPGQVQFREATKAIFKLRGGTGEIMNPVWSLVWHATRAIKAATENAVLNEIYKLATEHKGIGVVFESLPPKVRPINFTVDEVMDDLVNAGIVDADVAQNLPTGMGEQELKIWRTLPENKMDQTVVVRVDGKAKIVYVADPILLRTLEVMTPQQAHVGFQLINNILKHPTRLIRAGVVKTIGFFLRNIIDLSQKVFLKGNVDRSCLHGLTSKHILHTNLVLCQGPEVLGSGFIAVQDKFLSMQ